MLLHHYAKRMTGFETDRAMLRMMWRGGGGVDAVMFLRPRPFAEVQRGGICSRELLGRPCRILRSVKINGKVALLPPSLFIPRFRFHNPQ